MPVSLKAGKAGRTRVVALAFLTTVVPIATLVVWLTPLSFIPVPWPDDSAFYFVAREFFRWPPRWVMLPQAPFEPTYRIFNFNTMPLYPILIGLGRFLGIDGSFALKLWPLSAYALSGAWLVRRLGRAALGLGAAAAVALAFALDPTLHWAAVLVRPESLIGLCGVVLVLKLTFHETESHGLWDPLAALLAVAAYCHFNSVHLLFPVVASLLFQPRRLILLGARTALYLLPWVMAVLWHFNLFVLQMRLQWTRLAGGNDWLSTPTKALHGVFQSMGSPVPWPEQLDWASGIIWALMFGAAVALAIGLAHRARSGRGNREAPNTQDASEAAKSKRRKESHVAALEPTLIPAAAWVIGAAWLWETKPEVWFTYYLHEAVITFAGIAALTLRPRPLRVAAATSAFALAAIFANAEANIYSAISADPSWRWDTYHSFIDCIDDRLTDVQAGRSDGSPFSVWDPTFPDITIELSRRHPQWELTRTNDFYMRNALAIAHGKAVDVVVVPEIWGETGRHVQGLAENYIEIQSIWMNWKDYYLAQLGLDPTWHPKKYVCAYDKWQAFIYVNAKPSGR